MNELPGDVTVNDDGRLVGLGLGFDQLHVVLLSFCSEHL
jgi:hypothetical protein